MVSEIHGLLPPKHIPFAILLTLLWLVCLPVGWVVGGRSWVGALATGALFPVWFTINCSFWVTTAFTIAWILLFGLTEDEEDVDISPCFTVLVASFSSSLIWALEYTYVYESMVSDCWWLCWPNDFCLSPNLKLRIKTDGSWSSCLTMSRSDSQSSSLVVWKTLPWKHLSWFWIGHPRMSD